MSPKKEFMKPREIAERSGLSLAYIYESMHKGELSHVKFGARYRVSEKQYQSWVKRLTR